jgi:hypothetical protein
MSDGTISGNTAGSGGGVNIHDGIFTMTGGIIYGDSPADTITPQNSGPNANTAISTYPPNSIGKLGHAVMYFTGSFSSDPSYYRNEDLGTGDNISTTDTLPAAGQTDNNWTRRP